MLLEVEEAKVISEFVVAEPKPFVVVGIPAFNEATMIRCMIIEAQKYADVVVVCDDGSSDRTGRIAESNGADVVRHERNMGYGASIRSLFQRALELGADVLVTIDADGQHVPSEIPSIIKPIVQNSADLVIGSRFIDKNGTKEMPFYRRFGAQLITRLVNSSSKNGVSDAQSGFRAYNRQALEHLRPLMTGMGASVEILLKASQHDLRLYEVPSSCKYNNGGVATSSENPITHGIGVVMSIIKLIVEQRPLTILGIPGLLCLFAGSIFGIWIVQIYSLENQILALIALTCTGLILIGFFLVSTAMTLYAIRRLADEINQKECK